MPLALNRVMSKMEFRIFHNIFCEMFNIQRSAFAFDEYVNNVFEKFVFTIVKIRPVNWLCLCGLLFLDYARTSNKLYFHHCGHEDIECVENSSLELYVLLGAIVFGLTVVFAVVARLYEIQIIRRKGIQASDYYASYLQVRRIDTAAVRCVCLTFWSVHGGRLGGQRGGQEQTQRAAAQGPLLLAVPCCCCHLCLI